MLDRYLQEFGKLRTDRGRGRYPEITWRTGGQVLLFDSRSRENAGDE